MDSQLEKEMVNQQANHRVVHQNRFGQTDCSTRQQEL